MNRLLKKLFALAGAMILILALAVPAFASTYTVKKGDSLWSISKQQLGSGARWREIYEANKDVIKNPNRIYVGQVLQIPGTEPAPEPTPEPPAGVDLSAFYANVTSMHEFGFLELADATLLDGYYAGLTSIPTEQRLVYICQMSMNNGEFGLVQVKNSADAARVKAIFQARIDRMSGADGQGKPGAWYPGPTEQWLNNSRVVSNGNYVMMVVHENCDQIVAEFNALF